MNLERDKKMFVKSAIGKRLIISGNTRKAFEHAWGRPRVGKPLKTSTDVGKVVGVADVTDKGRAKGYEFLGELDGAVRRGVTGSTRDGMMICERKIRVVVRWGYNRREGNAERSRFAVGHGSSGILGSSRRGRKISEIRCLAVGRRQ
jgi:hypothetical protein